MAGEFSSPGSTLHADSYFSICPTPMLLQQHVKDPINSAKCAGGRLQLNTQAPYIYHMASNKVTLYGVHRDALRVKQLHVAPAM